METARFEQVLVIAGFRNVIPAQTGPTRRIVITTASGRLDPWTFIVNRKPNYQISRPCTKRRRVAFRPKLRHGAAFPADCDGAPPARFNRSHAGWGCLSPGSGPPMDCDRVTGSPLKGDTLGSVSSQEACLFP